MSALSVAVVCSRRWWALWQLYCYGDNNLHIFLWTMLYRALFNICWLTWHYQLSVFCAIATNRAAVWCNSPFAVTYGDHACLQYIPIADRMISALRPHRMPVMIPCNTMQLYDNGDDEPLTAKRTGSRWRVTTRQQWRRQKRAMTFFGVTVVSRARVSRAWYAAWVS